MATTIAVVSGSTGVGKSALTATIGAQCAQRGQRTRIIGLDDQCTVSLWYGQQAEPDDGELYVADLLKGRARIRTGAVGPDGKPAKRVPTIEDIERNTKVEGLTIVPEAETLEHDLSIIAQLGNVGDVLRDQVWGAPRVDLNILDGPGELNVLSNAAIMAADWILIVVAPTIKQVRIHKLMDRIDELRSRGATARIAGIVPNIVPSSRDGSVYANILQEFRGDDEDGYADLMLPQIRRQHYETWAFAQQTPLPISYPRAGVTKDYQALLEALDQRGVTVPAIPSG